MAAVFLYLKRREVSTKIAKKHLPVRNINWKKAFVNG
jgi:hypothetical protein